MIDYKKKALRGTILVFVMTIITAFLSYLFRRLLALNLTKTEYGLFYSIIAVIGLLAMFRSLGLGEALIKFISEFLIKRKYKLVKSSILTVLFLQLSSSSIVVILFMSLSSYLSINYFHNPLSFAVLNILLIGFLFSCFEYIYNYIFSGFQRMDYLSSLEFVRTTLNLILIYILFYFTKSVIVPAISYVVVYFMISFIYFPFLIKIFPTFFKIKAKFSSELTKKLLKFGLPVTIGSFGWLILTYTDTLTLTYFKGLEAVALYNVALPIATLLWYFSRSIITVIFPMSSELWIKNKEYISKGLNLLQKYSFAFIIPFALTVFSFPDVIIRILFGEPYVGASLALKILALGTIVYTVASINIVILIAINRPKLNTKIILIGAVLNIILNLLLIPKWSIVGAAIATSSSYLLILILTTFKLRPIVKSEYPWINWFKTLISGGVFIFIIWILKRTLDMNVWLEAAICIISALIVYVFLVYIFRVVNKKDIKEVMGYIFKRK